MNQLGVASCRSKKSLLTDLKNIVMTLDTLQWELNECIPKSQLRLSRDKIYKVIENEGYHISPLESLNSLGSFPGCQCP